MQLRQQQKPINEARGWQFSVLQAEVFDAVGKPLITSFDLGIPPHVVREIVGHSDIEVTMTIYAHVSLDEKRKALGRLGDALG